MPLYSLLFGGLLIALGLQGYYDFSGLLGVDKLHSGTALIPAYFGAGLSLMGLLSLLAPGMKKHFMHFAAMIGLLGAIGGAMRPLMAAMSGKLDLSSVPTKLQIAMAILSLFFVAMCIDSFIQARRRREAAEAR